MSAREIQQLIRMANQIALNIGAGTEPGVAASKTAEHLRKFWTPAMREQLQDYCQAGGDGLEPVVSQALLNTEP